MIEEFIQFRDILQLYHWNTKKYARHVASGELYKKVNELLDTLIETMQSNGARIKTTNKKIMLKNCSDTEIITVLEKFSVFLEKINTKRREINNIIDELLMCIKQTLYLFTMV